MRAATQYVKRCGGTVRATATFGSVEAMTFDFEPLSAGRAHA
jgi:hypothetical protein